ncbi:Holliday junction branch migration DNA helicase RuvB [Borrelia duttonii]|uniref:Holliday junction branch migration complex subunit RuvB n=1 Tax=Borrelia duttonii (strain Ly) TaxID=412419 RepID=B5RLN0_BORDL|nr:Holliday junction DNA helicase [Borrelia duttonii Ly]
MDLGFLNSEKNFLYDNNEDDLRPEFLKDFSGQSHIKDNLDIFIKASRDRNEALDHVFLSGPPGLGKTTLASIIALEMNTTIKITSAPAFEKPKDIVGILMTLNDKSVLFIDEIHRLKPAIEEMLYIAMEDYKIDCIVGQGAVARTVRMSIPKFTLIGATTKPGKVASPLYARFGIVFRFDLYNEDELSKIIKRSAFILNVKLNDKAALLLAKSSRGTPRMANKLLRRMRDFAQVGGYDLITEDVVTAGLEMLKIDHEGLDEQDRNILKNLILKFRGGPVGIETLAIAVGETADSLEDFYEPYLVLRGFIERTNRGRRATDFAYLHLNLNKNNQTIFDISR